MFICILHCPLLVSGGLGAILVRGSPTGNTAPAKTEWPEVVGLTAEDSEKKISKDVPNVTVRVVEPDHCEARITWMLAT